MKGLLLKDLYMMRRHLRSWLLMMLIFIAVSCLESDNMFFVFYPCMLSGMVPVTLLGYDERNKWDVYAGTLPCSRAQVVSAKYLIGLMVHAAVLLLTALTQAVRMAVTASFAWGEYLTMLAILVMLGLISAAMTMPFMFKLGVEKGRLAYYAMVGLIGGSGALFPWVVEPAMEQTISFGFVLVLALLAVLALYVLSWYLSIRFYEKRELK